MKRHRSDSERMIAKYMKISDPQLAAIENNFYSVLYPDYPLATVECIRLILDNLALENPEAARRDAREFVDHSPIISRVGRRQHCSHAPRHQGWIGLSQRQSRKSRDSGHEEKLLGRPGHRAPGDQPFSNQYSIAIIDSLIAAAKIETEAKKLGGSDKFFARQFVNRVLGQSR